MPINNVGKMEALEIEDGVLEAISDTGGEGLTIKACSDLVGMQYCNAYRAIHELARLGRVKIAVVTGNETRVLLPHWEDPAPIDLCQRQRAVLDFLCSKMDANNLVRESYRNIAIAIGAKHPVADSIYSLDRYGYLEVVERGNPHRANLFRVYPDQTGPQEYSWFV